MKLSTKMITVLILAISTFFCTGCSKDDYADQDHSHLVIQTQVYEFSLTFPATNQRGSEVLYEGLEGKIGKDDAILVYSKISGVTGWWALPYVLSGISYMYAYDYGTLDFYAQCVDDGYILSGSISTKMRVVVIPHEAYAEKFAQGVDHNNYEMVVKAYHLEDSQVTDLDIETSK